MMGYKYRNDSYYNLWSLIDISQYKQYNKYEYLTFFSVIKTIITINNQLYYVNSTADNLEEDIKTQSKTMVTKLQEGFTNLIGFIASIPQFIWDGILYLGEFIYNALKSIVTFILSIISQIINLVEAFIEIIIIPIISFYTVYLTCIGGGNMIFMLKSKRFKGEGF